MRIFMCCWAVALLCACERQPVGQPAPRATVEKDALKGVLISISAGREGRPDAPEMVIACNGSDDPSVYFYLKQTPSTPPPLSNVYGSYSFDKGRPSRVELGWLTGDGWTFRNDDQAMAGFVKSFLASNEVTVSFPPKFYVGDPIKWQRDAAKEVEQAIGTWCPKPPS